MKFLSKGSKKEMNFQRYIGLNFKQIDILAKIIEPLWDANEITRLERAKRNRASGTRLL